MLKTYFCEYSVKDFFVQNSLLEDVPPPMRGKMWIPRMVGQRMVGRPDPRITIRKPVVCCQRSKSLKGLMATLPGHDPVAKDDVNCVMSTTSQKCRYARDEEKQGKPGTR